MRRLNTTDLADIECQRAGCEWRPTPSLNVTFELKQQLILDIFWTCGSFERTRNSTFCKKDILTFRPHVQPGSSALKTLRLITALPEIFLTTPAKRRITDPDSAIAKAGSGPHFEQAYNAQLDGHGAMPIVSERASVAPEDQQPLVPTVAAIRPVVQPEIETILTGRDFSCAAAAPAKIGQLPHSRIFSFRQAGRIVLSVPHALLS